LSVLLINVRDVFLAVLIYHVVLWKKNRAKNMIG